MLPQMTPHRKQESMAAYFMVTFVVLSMLLIVLILRLLVSISVETSSTSTAVISRSPYVAELDAQALSRIFNAREVPIIVDGIVYEAAFNGITAEVWQPGMQHIETYKVVGDGVIYDMTDSGIIAENWDRDYTR